MPPDKALVKAKKEKKDRYLHDFLELRRHFTPLVFSADGIPRTEVQDATHKMASNLRFKLNRDYYEMCGFVQSMMVLAEVQSDTLLLQGIREKEAKIRQHPGLLDGAVMALLAPWQE